MNNTLYDGYRNAGQHLNGVTDWYLNLHATYGTGTVLATQAAALIALFWTACALLDHIEDRRHRRNVIRQLEAFANHPANRTRKEDRP